MRENLRVYTETVCITWPHVIRRREGDTFFEVESEYSSESASSSGRECDYVDENGEYRIIYDDEGRGVGDWREDARGPTCECGSCTVVKSVDEKRKEWMFVCYTHMSHYCNGDDRVIGTSWDLPKHKPDGMPSDPEKWPGFLWPEAAEEAKNE